jgi:hypothetical protein
MGGCVVTFDRVSLLTLCSGPLLARPCGWISRTGRTQAAPSLYLHGRSSHAHTHARTQEYVASYTRRRQTIVMSVPSGGV